MPNAKDHAVAVGMQTLQLRPFDEIDSLILTQIVYMPLEGLLGKGERATLAQAGEFLRGEYPDGFSDPFQQKRFELTLVCAENPRYQAWELHDYYNKIDPEREMQFCVCSFDLPLGQTYVAFRGTDWSLTGWKEDLNMSFMTVPSQQEAVEYMERIATGSGNAFMLGGHSKGGNLAVFAGARVSGSVQERIRRVYCFDGPGVDEETLNSLEYELISERIASYLPQSSIVGMLLHYHPVYTVVRSKSYGILQHDAMKWQIREGEFVTVDGVDFSGRMTDETLHGWLKTIDMDTRRLLVDTVYKVLEASQEETLDGMIKDWHESALRMLEALRELDPEVRKHVERILKGLFGAGAAGAVRSLLPHVLRKNADEDEEQDEI